jgi:hypothetical protein
MQAELMGDNTDHISRINALSDEQIMADAIQAMPTMPQAMRETLEQVGAGQLRKLMIQQVTRSPEEMGPGARHDIEMLFRLCPVDAATRANELLRNRRQLELPQAMADAAAFAPDLPRRVNPTVWPSTPPYFGPSGGGGLTSPWDLLVSFFEVEVLSSAAATRKGQPLASDVPSAAERIFGLAAAALRRLTAVTIPSGKLRKPVVGYPGVVSL